MTQLELIAEKQRRQGQTSKMLDEFKKRTELTTADLMKIGTGCSSRLKELRREGHVIVAQYEKPGMWRYTYVGQKDTEQEGRAD
jgi:hypothetical protein